MCVCMSLSLSLSLSLFVCLESVHGSGRATGLTQSHSALAQVVAIQRVVAIQWCTANSSARMSLLHSATTASSVHHRRLACSALMMPRERARVQMRAEKAYTVVQVQTHDHAVRPARVTLPLADIDDNIPSVGPQRIGRQIQPLNMCTHT